MFQILTPSVHLPDAALKIRACYKRKRQPILPISRRELIKESWTFHHDWAKGIRTATNEFPPNGPSLSFTHCFVSFLHELNPTLWGESLVVALEQWSFGLLHSWFNRVVLIFPFHWMCLATIFSLLALLWLGNALLMHNNFYLH